jgi:hypothetical protein
MAPKHYKEINVQFQINTHDRNTGQSIPDSGSRYQIQVNSFNPGRALLIGETSMLKW